MCNAVFPSRSAIVHRDIKPANLLLDKKGVVKILDMGLARMESTEPETEHTVSQELTQAGMVMGILSRIQNIGYDMVENGRTPDWYRANHRTPWVAKRTGSVCDFLDVFFVKLLRPTECTPMDPEIPQIHEQFLMLFTADEPAIRAYVRRLVPTRHDAADVMQGVSLVLWKKFRELEQPSDFRKWSFGVARYETLAWLRDKARDRLVLAEDVLHTLAHESTRDEARLSAQREALEGCLEKLPKEQRTVILAAYAPDAAIQDVAKQSGRTVAAFYQWLHRMRLRLLECTRRTLQAEELA